MKYINAIIFTLLSLIYLTFSNEIKFSTNFIEIFFSQDSLKLFDRAKQFGLSDEIFIAKKGFDKKSLQELEQIAKKVKNLHEITQVQITFENPAELKEYYKKNYYLLSEFNNTKPSKEIIFEKIKQIHDKIYNSVFYEPINTYDPLDLFSMDFEKSSKYIKIKEYGYALKAKTSVDTSDAKSSRVVYDKLHSILQMYDDVIVYAPFFFLVENSEYIRSDAQNIMMIATLLLLILYFIILKNYRLFFNAIFTIGSSILSAILLSSLYFESISILALVFGISITTISIDYMFHYYFHEEFSFNKKVFLGFLTTFGVFFIFSFIDIELFSQLAFFSLISLGFSYVIFTFIFPYVDIAFHKNKKSATKRVNFNPLHVTVICVILFAFTYNNLEFDNDLKNLDYENEKLTKIAKIFEQNTKSAQYRSVLIKADSKELLLEKYEKILKKYPDMLGIGKFVLSQKKCKQRIEKLEKFDFQNIKQEIEESAKKLGFKKETFKNAYINIDDIHCSMQAIDAMKFKIIQDDSKYYTLALIEKSKLQEDTLFDIVDLAKTLTNDTKKMRDTLLKYLYVSFVFIFFILLYIAKKEFLYPLVYLLFPIATTLFVVSLLGKINIMHMFGLIILVAISIDYGIYMYKSDTLSQTRMAIKYALMSTFFGFGVLIFSQTQAMHSIGLVITIGICSIFFLLYGKIAR